MPHNICINEQGSLVIRLDGTGDEHAYVQACLEEGQFKKNEGSYTYDNTDKVKFDKNVEWATRFFTKQFGETGVEICDAVKNKVQARVGEDESYKKAISMGRAIKETKEHNPALPMGFRRTLMNYQRMSVEHMIKVGNAANFSVPGSGKTTITYAAISRWMEDGVIEKILVIGPTSSFMPWEDEYVGCFGKKPNSMRVRGELAKVFHERGDEHDLFLMHFQTAMTRPEGLKKFMGRWDTVLIIDESHYIKNPDLGKWGSTVMDIAPHAKRRIALSGTPMPNNAKDLWTQITFLWPHHFPLDRRLGYNAYAKHHGVGKYADVLNSLFCRIKKNDLDLPKPTSEVSNVCSLGSE